MIGVKGSKGMTSIRVGKQRYKLFKHRYFIGVDEVTTYYYDEYFFWKAFFEVMEEYEVNSLEETILGLKISR